MSRIKLAFHVAAVFVVFLACQSLAQAQATRTWVSGVGDDANPCSRTAPCKTFAGAISKTAAGGEINALDPGGYGAVTITKSITIDATGTFGASLAALTNGIVVNAAATDRVTLRGLSINGAGNGLVGVKLLSAGELNIERCEIFNFVFAGSGVGVLVETNVLSRVSISDTVVRSNGGGGIFFNPASGGSVKATISRVRSEGNLYGFRADDNVTVTISDSVAANNQNNGFVAFSELGSSAVINLERCVTTNNGLAGIDVRNPLAMIRMSNVTTTANSTGITINAGGQVISYGNNQIAGNTVSDGNPTLTITPR
ncbi:MAG: right-handed parallel beta-helix repeat-containing protein [Acidobacteriota bacterium]|nr:right-handed parallel beta-helix repeat-containing protein [Acidobacteriota bacterium]